MTPDKLALTPRAISRLLTFIVTLVIGIGLSQLLPLRIWQVANELKPASTNQQFKRDCPRYR